jgi:glutathione peroxidase
MNVTPLLAALSLAFLASCSGFFTKQVPKTEFTSEMTLHSMKVESLDAGPVDLARYKGDVLLVVNVASECGLTPQYAGLETLEKELAPKGFHVLGFPSNEFGGQEPGAPDAIRRFCTERFAVTFPLFAKVATKAGPEQSPVYAYLGGATGKLPGWNFGKYLVGRDGKPLGFYDSRVGPDDAQLRADIEQALAAR